MEGSGKASFHLSTGHIQAWNSMRAKRCFRARGTHDSETTQQVLSAVGSPCSWSTMRSRISGGRDDIVASAGPVRRWFPRTVDSRDVLCLLVLPPETEPVPRAPARVHDTHQSLNQPGALDQEAGNGSQRSCTTPARIFVRGTNMHTLVCPLPILRHLPNPHLSTHLRQQ